MVETTKLLRTLIVDDDEMMTKLIHRALSNKIDDRVLLTSTTDATQAIAMAKGGQVDICLTDMDMPEINGFKLLKQIKQVNPLSQVILLTAHPTKNAAKSAFQMGADDFFAKPVDLDAICTSVEFLINRLIRWQDDLLDSPDTNRQSVSGSQSTE